MAGNNNYESIDTRNAPEGIMPFQDLTSSRKSNRRRMLLAVPIAMMIVGCLLALTFQKKSLEVAEDEQITYSTANLLGAQKSDSNTANGLKFGVASGVNIGSWLALEDWFYVGEGAAVEVATPDDNTVAACLPPLHIGPSTGPRWNSETDLFANLSRQTSVKHALHVFHAHRTSFIDFDDDLETLQSLGVTSVRVPMSWCLTDYDPNTDIDDENDDDATLLEKFTCTDPFFGEDVHWPAVPKSLVADFLRACARHNIGATLDIHTYPGGTSIGTFSGVWPRWPRFWTHGDQPVTDDDNNSKDIGHSIFEDWLTWLESLSESDPEAFKGLRAISPMNEPAHLAGLFGGPDAPIPNSENFLPPLSPRMSESYLDEINGSNYKRTIVPDGPHLRVLFWLHNAVALFRSSKLVALGKELHMNVHESIFSPTVLPKGEDGESAGAIENEKNKYAMHIIASWWASTTSRTERESWAILDIHHYHAWDPYCSGTVVNSHSTNGNYTCHDHASRDETFKRCSQWIGHNFRSAVDEECGHPGARLMSAEFSASTHHSVRYACNDVSTLRATYNAQVEASQHAEVELFWWSYKMPHGGAFKNAWSFKHFMYLMDMIPHPDESEFDCGNHVVVTPDEPVDKDAVVKHDSE